MDTFTSSLATPGISSLHGVGAIGLGDIERRAARGHAFGRSRGEEALEGVVEQAVELARVARGRNDEHGASYNGCDKQATARPGCFPRPDGAASMAEEMPSDGSFSRLPHLT
jgi:hypothetical protein